MSFKFERLVVWQKAVDLSEKVNQLVKTFPKEEVYVLSAQMKRAADSVSLNIAEGSTGQSDPEFRKFLGYALRSNIEVVTCLYIAKRRGYIDELIFKEIYYLCQEILAMINAMRRHLNSNLKG